MTTQEEIFAYDRLFRFEPPVEVGDHEVDTLQELARIAFTGYEAGPEVVKRYDAFMAVELNKAPHPEIAVRTLNRLLKYKHTVTLI